MPKYLRPSTVDTKLADWIRNATEEQRQELASKCNTSLNYLRQLAHAHRENPRVRFALKIVEQANLIRAAAIYRGVYEDIEYVCYLPILDIYDIAEPTKRPAICETSTED